MTEFTMLKNDELQEINGGSSLGDFLAGTTYSIFDYYVMNTMMDPNHYLGKPDYRTWYN